MRLIAEGCFHQMILANLHVVFVVLTCGMWMNCAVASETRRPSVLWIMLDDCRGGHDMPEGSRPTATGISERL